MHRTVESTISLVALSELNKEPPPYLGLVFSITLFSYSPATVGSLDDCLAETALKQCCYGCLRRMFLASDCI